MFDLVLKNLAVVRPGRDTVENLDIGIAGGRFAALDPEIKADLAKLGDDNQCRGDRRFRSG